MKKYELVFIADPRLSEEDVVALTDEYKAMLTSAGGTITKEESWGKKKLAYPIQKLNEGYYVLLHVELEERQPVPRDRAADAAERQGAALPDRAARRGPAA